MDPNTKKVFEDYEAAIEAGVKNPIMITRAQAIRHERERKQKLAAKKKARKERHKRVKQARKRNR